MGIVEKISTPGMSNKECSGMTTKFKCIPSGATVVAVGHKREMISSTEKPSKRHKFLSLHHETYAIEWSVSLFFFVCADVLL
jgi:hypothetical protein